MFDRDEYFKGLSFVKIMMVIMIIFCIMALFKELSAEDNKSLEINTAEVGWPTQVVYDSVNACHQGTYRWIVLSNPSLIGIIPPPQTQRAMIQHCFCVLDRVRKDYKFTDYLQMTPNQEMVGTLYYQTALKCVTENGTLRGIITLEPKSDNETKKDKTIVPDKPEKKDTPKKESLPDQPKEEKSNGLPETIFQG